jgi:hypothetical protein
LWYFKLLGEIQIYKTDRYFLAVVAGSKPKSFFLKQLTKKSRAILAKLMQMVVISPDISPFYDAVTVAGRCLGKQQEKLVGSTLCAVSNAALEVL